MNRSEIRSTMRTFLNESSAGFWSDAALNTYINLANHMINSFISNIREDFFTVSATFQTVANQKAYAMPTDCRFIRRLELYDPDDPGFIIKLDEQRFPRTEAGGDWAYTENHMPKEYVVYGGQFNLLPIPDTAYDMRIYYDARNASLTLDTDIPASPLDFHDMLVFLACLYAKKQNEEDDSSFAELYAARKEELISFLVSRGSDDPRTVEGYLEGLC